MMNAENLQYIKERWAKLSPAFRAAHNRLRQKLGMETLPPPKLDLYVPPQAPPLKPFDMNNTELVASAKQFLGGTIMAPGAEGFTINGASAAPLPRHRRRPDRHAEAIADNSEGFSVR